MERQSKDKAATGMRPQRQGSLSEIIKDIGISRRSHPTSPGKADVHALVLRQNPIWHLMNMPRITPGSAQRFMLDSRSGHGNSKARGAPLHSRHNHGGSHIVSRADRLVMESLLDDMGYSGLTVPEHLRAMHRLLMPLKIKPTDFVLDAGCGNGLFAKALVRLTSVGMDKYLGIDKNKTAINVAKRLTQADPHRFKWSTKRLENLAPLHNECFDVVVCIGVFNFFDDMQEVHDSMKELLRVTKRGGRILIADVNNADVKDDPDVARDMSGFIDEAVERGMDSRGALWFDKMYWKRWARKKGLKLSIMDHIDLDEMGSLPTCPYRYSVYIKKKNHHGIKMHSPRHPPFLRGLKGSVVRPLRNSPSNDSNSSRKSVSFSLPDASSTESFFSVV